MSVARKSHLGLAHYFCGRLDEAEAVLREAVGHWIRSATGSGCSPTISSRHIYTVRGDIPRELAEAEAEIAIGTLMRRSGDCRLGAIRQGRRPRAGGSDRRGRGPFHPRRRVVDAHGSLGREHRLPASSASPASRPPTTPEPGSRSSNPGHRSSGLSPSSSSWPDVTRCSSRACSGPAGPTRRADRAEPLAQKARRESRFARFIGWRYRNYGPHALRVSGRAAFALGKTKQAARYLERSIAAAEKLGARYDLARALLDASLVIPDKADDYRRRGQQLLDELGAVVPEAERLPLTASGTPVIRTEPAHEGRSEAVAPCIHPKQERSEHVATRLRRHPGDQATAFVGGQLADRPGDRWGASRRVPGL